MAEKDTVFVRGIAKGVNSEELNEIFAEVGPVKSAFIVVEKDGPRKGESRGFGFVQFALSEDAEEAVEKFQGKQLAGSKLILELAEKKGFKVDKSMKKAVGNDAVKSILNEKSPAQKKPTGGHWKAEQKKELTIFEELAKDSIVTNASSEAQGAEDSADQFKKTVDLLRDCSAVIFNLPPGTKESDLRKKAGKAGKVNLVKIPYSCGDPVYPMESRSGLVVFTKRTSVATALQKLNNKEWDFGGGISTVSCRQLSKVAHNPKSKERCRLILRNLDFNVNDAALFNAFNVFGPVIETKVIVDEAKNNKSKGYGFVQFACRFDAEKAREELNGKKIGRRIVAVDWALNKDTYKRILKGEHVEEDEPADEEKEPADEEEGSNESNSSDSSSESSSDSESSDDDDESGSSEEDENKGSDASEGEEVDDDEVDEDENEEDDENMIRFEDEDEKEEEQMDVSDDESEDEESKKANEISTTLFVRNLLFETTQETVFTEFRKYGAVRYVKVTKGPDGRSRGSAFVNFYNGESVERALEAAEQIPLKLAKSPGKKVVDEAIDAVRQRGGMGIAVEGRNVFVTVAIDKTLAHQITEKTKEKPVKSDKRHIYLSREGFIAADSDTQIPKSDLKKRERAEKEKKTKLANPLFFVSPTRLSIRNLFLGSKDGSEDPVSERMLRSAFEKAADEGLKRGLVGDNEGDQSLFPLGWPDRNNLQRAEVEKVILIRDEVPIVENKRPKKSEVGRLKGYGFVEFTTHVHALAALRQLNNNPAYSYLAVGGPKSMKVNKADRSRLIVEFAVENAAKLRLQQQRHEKKEAERKLQDNAKKAKTFAERQTKDSNKKKDDSNKKKDDSNKKKDDNAVVGGKRKGEPLTKLGKRAEMKRKVEERKAARKRRNEEKEREQEREAKRQKRESRATKQSFDRKERRNKSSGDKNSKKTKKQAPVDSKALVEQYKQSLFFDNNPSTSEKTQKRWFDV